MELKTKFHDIIDDLTEAQKNRLNESIRQSDTGKTIPHETMRAEIKEWLQNHRKGVRLDIIILYHLRL